MKLCGKRSREQLSELSWAEDPSVDSDKPLSTNFCCSPFAKLRVHAMLTSKIMILLRVRTSASCIAWYEVGVRRERAISCLTRYVAPRDTVVKHIERATHVTNVQMPVYDKVRSKLLTRHSRRVVLLVWLSRLWLSVLTLFFLSRWNHPTHLMFDGFKVLFWGLISITSLEPLPRQDSN